MLLALILRQFGLSVFRSGSNTQRVSQFFKDNYEFYELLKENLNHTITNHNIEIERGGEIEKKMPTGIIANFFIKKTCFYEIDFHQIIKIYFSGIEILESGNIQQNEKWSTIGHELMVLTHQLIEPKLSKTERKIVIRIEHFEQNELVYEYYYSIEEALDLLIEKS